jgi:hypothetical protein
MPQNGAIPDEIRDGISLLAIRNLGDQPVSGIRPAGAGMAGRTAILRGVLLEVGSILMGRVGNSLGGGEDHELGIMVTRLGWQSWYVPALHLKHYLPQTRLNKQYLDRLRIDAIECAPWLEILQESHAPDFSKRRLIFWYLNLKLKTLRYGLLGLLPAKLDKRLQRAVFWKLFYQSQARGVWELIARHAEIKQILSRLTNLRSRLSPQSLEKQ